MEQVNQPLHLLERSLIWSGFQQLVPLSIFVTIFGAAFGMAAVQTEMADTGIIAMSAFVFAGTAQFAVLDLWGSEIPLFTLILTVFAINARHLLMGATLYPWLKFLPAHKRYGVLLVVSDANWALAMQAFNRGQPGLGLLFGGGLALWLFWLIGTLLGVQFANEISDARSLGLDMVMGCFLLAMLVGGDKNPRMLAIWSVAALVSLLAYEFLPENSHVVLGALAGGLAGLYWGTEKNEH